MHAWSSWTCAMDTVIIMYKPFIICLYTPTHTMHALSLPPSLPLSLSLSHAYILDLEHALSLSPSLPLSHTHAYILDLEHALSLSPSLPASLSLSLTHTHACMHDLLEHAMWILERSAHALFCLPEVYHTYTQNIDFLTQYADLYTLAGAVAIETL